MRTLWERYRRFEKWGERVFFSDHPIFWGVLFCILIPPFGIVVFIAWLYGRSDGRPWGSPWEEGDPWAKGGSHPA